MDHTSSTAHILVPRSAIPADRVLTFELFVKVGEKFIKVANRDEKIDEERISRYLNHERDVLYIDRGSLERFMDEKFGGLFEMITTPAFPIEERFDRFIRCLELGYIDLRIVRPHADKFMRIEMLMEWLYESFKKRELRKLLLHQVFWNVSQPISRRAILCSTLAANLTLEQSECTVATFKSLFAGGLYRDLAVPYPDNSIDLHFKTDMSEEELRAFREHPNESAEMLRNFMTVDDVTRAIIEQHHEEPAGTGYPRGLKRAQTFQPAQYMNLADFTLTELDKLSLTPDANSEAMAAKHLQSALPQEQQKNLPLLIRVLHPVFAGG